MQSEFPRIPSHIYRDICSRCESKEQATLELTKEEIARRILEDWPELTLTTAFAYVEMSLQTCLTLKPDWLEIESQARRLIYEAKIVGK